MARRRTRQDWIDAALAALLDEGPSAVAVQPLARRLGATKGSFYWHFDTREQLLRATLEAWEDAATEQVIARVEHDGGSPADRARRLFATVTADGSGAPGHLLLLAGVADPDVARAVRRSTSRRVAYVAGLLRAAGLPRAVAARRATLAYAAYLGFAQLARSAPDALPRGTVARRALLDELTAALLPPEGQPPEGQPPGRVTPSRKR